MSSERESPAQRLRQALDRHRVADNVVAAWNGERPYPATGQVWRANWHGTTQLILILDVLNSSVRGAPLTLDDELADEDCVVLSPAEGPFDVAETIWLGLIADIPMRVLDRHAGEVPEGLTGLDALHRSLDSNRVRRGRPALSPADPKLRYRARLRDRMERFRRAADSAGTGELAGILKNSGVTPGVLAETLNVKPARALALIRGQAALGEPEAEALSSVLRVPAVDLLEANPAPPEGIVVIFDQPSTRARVQRLADRRSVDEYVARDQAIRGSWALAARQTGAQAEPDWQQRVDRYFEVAFSE